MAQPPITQGGGGVQTMCLKTTNFRYKKTFLHVLFWVPIAVNCYQIEPGYVPATLTRNKIIHTITSCLKTSTTPKKIGPLIINLV